MKSFDRVPNAVIRSSALLIHGSNLHFYGARLADCAIICNTQSACLAFVDHRGASPPFCTFKSDSQFSAASGSGVAAAAAKDVYVRRERREALPSSNPYTMVPLTSQSWANETRVHAINGFLSEHEALALRRHATDCFTYRILFDRFGLVPRAQPATPHLRGGASNEPADRLDV